MGLEAGASADAAESSVGGSMRFQPQVVDVNPRPPSTQVEVRHNRFILAAFFLLPRELQVRILNLSIYELAPLHIDGEAAIGLLCACKILHSLALPIVYAHINIDRPTSLLSLYRAVLAHPERGSLIRSLRLGPCNELPAAHWPLRFRKEDEQSDEPLIYGALWLRTSLHQSLGSSRRPFSYYDECLAPRWLKPNHEICLSNAPPTCHGKALLKAIEAAIEVLDVEPYARGHAKSGSIIGLASWTTRIFELRACADLYLIQMRSVEDESEYEVPDWRAAATLSPRRASIHDCQLEKCYRYPLFVVERLSQAPCSRRVNTATHFLLPRVQLARHLSRPHCNSMLDRFDHPLVFARSGYPLPDADVDQAGQRQIRALLGGPRSGSDLDDDDDFFDNEEDDEAQANGQDGQQTLLEAPAAANSEEHGAGNAAEYMRNTALPLSAAESLPSVETLGGLLALAQTLLALAPNLANLSLTGIFHRLLASKISMPSTAVRSLCIGPVLPYWQTLLSRHGVGKLVNVEKLRICVETLSSEEIDLICGQHDAMPQLREVQWEMVQPKEPSALRDESIKSFAKLASRLQGPLETAASSFTHNRGVLGKRSRDSYEQGSPLPAASSSRTRSDKGKGKMREESAPEPHRPRSEVSVEILAHAEALPALLDKAPSKEARAAWQEGKWWVDELNGTAHRIHLAASQRAKEPRSSRGRADWSVGNRLHAESEEWWSRDAMRCVFEEADAVKGSR